MGLDAAMQDAQRMRNSRLPSCVGPGRDRHGQLGKSVPASAPASLGCPPGRGAMVDEKREVGASGSSAEKT